MNGADYDNTQNNFIGTRNALDILKEYYDEFSSLRLLGFAGSLTLTFFLTWFIPTILQKVFRDGWGLEINYESESYKNLLMNRFFIKNGFLDSIKPTYVENNYKTDNPVKIFFKTNLFALFYLVIRLGIFGLGSFLSFLIISQDLISIIASFSIAGIITMVQFGVYLQHLFAHICMILTSKFKKGDYVTFIMTGASGVIIEMGVLDTTLLAVNPDWSEIKKITILSQQQSNSSANNQQQQTTTAHLQNIHASALSNKTARTPGASRPPALSTNPLLSSDPSDTFLNFYTTRAPSIATAAEYPFRGKFFSDHRTATNHLGYDTPFIELRVPNFDMLFSHLYVNRE
jgi:hypothetical protein